MPWICMGNRCIDPRFLDLSISWSQWSASRPGRFIHWKKASLSIEAGWASELVWTTSERRKNPLQGLRPLSHPARSQSQSLSFPLLFMDQRVKVSLIFNISCKGGQMWGRMYRKHDLDDHWWQPRSIKCFCVDRTCDQCRRVLLWQHHICTAKSNSVYLHSMIKMKGLEG
jgi:hypothetical protein